MALAALVSGAVALGACARIVGLYEDPVLVAEDAGHGAEPADATEDAIADDAAADAAAE